MNPRRLGAGARSLAPGRAPSAPRAADAPAGTCLTPHAAGSHFPSGGSGRIVASRTDAHVDFYLSSS